MIDGTANSNIQLRIYDLIGNVVSEQNMILGSDQDSFKVELENGAKGIYFVDLISNGSRITKKIIVD